MRDSRATAGRRAVCFCVAVSWVRHVGCGRESRRGRRGRLRCLKSFRPGPSPERRRAVEKLLPPCTRVAPTWMRARWGRGHRAGRGGTPVSPYTTSPPTVAPRAQEQSHVKYLDVVIIYASLPHTLMRVFYITRSSRVHNHPRNKSIQRILIYTIFIYMPSGGGGGCGGLSALRQRLAM